MTNAMTSKTPRKVRAPFRSWVQMLCRRFVPVVIWVAAIGLLTVMAKTQVHHVDAVGIVESRKVDVASLVDGTIRAIGVEPFDEVKEGAVLVLFDDSLIQAELTTARAELTRLRADLDAARSEWDRESLDDRRRYEVNEEEARLDLLDRVVDQEADRVELARLQMLMQNRKRLEGITAREEYDSYRLEFETMQTKIAENEKAISYARKRLQDTLKRREAREDESAQNEVMIALAPFKNTITVQTAQIEYLNQQISRHVLRAPMDGVIANIDFCAGQAVLKGIPLMTVSDPSSTRVTAWVNEQNLRKLQIGTQVEVVSRRFPRDEAEARVLKVGARVQRFPWHLSPNDNMPQWGVAVLIGNIPDQLFFPGELLDVRFVE